MTGSEDDRKVEKLGKRISALKTKTTGADEPSIDSASSMRRLAYLAAGGCGVVLIYGFADGQKYFATISVALMTACAAAVLKMARMSGFAPKETQESKILAARYRPFGCKPR
jgi:hypothetical protein